MDLPDVTDTWPLYDFLDAVHDMAPEFTGYWRAQILVLEHKDKKLPDIYKILEFFRNNIRLVNAKKVWVAHGAFAVTFQGQGLDGKTPESKDGKPIKLCLCGMLYRFKTC